MLVRMQRKGNLLTVLVGMQTGRATQENSIEVPQKFIFFKILFVYLTERNHKYTERQAEREREGSRLPAEQRARCGTRSQDPEIMT